MKATETRGFWRDVFGTRFWFGMGNGLQGIGIAGMLMHPEVMESGAALFVAGLIIEYGLGKARRLPWNWE